jgi:hypothetical protein
MEIHKSGDIHALFYHDGKLILRTKRSHGSGKLTGRIPDYIRQQMKLNQEQFSDLLACPLKREGYVQILRAKGHI